MDCAAPEAFFNAQRPTRDGRVGRGEPWCVNDGSLLHREQLDVLNLRRLSKQLIGPLHEPGGILAIEVRLTAVVISERIEDAER